MRYFRNRASAELAAKLGAASTAVGTITPPAGSGVIRMPGTAPLGQQFVHPTEYASADGT